MGDLLQQSESADQPKRGDIRKGVIARITANEVLVSIGTKSEGVIPAKELEKLDAAARGMLHEGQEITVYVINPEDHAGNVLLSLARAQEETDWHQVEELMASQTVYAGRVDGFNKGGLIVKVGNLRGFVPASQFSLSRRHRSEGETPEQKWSKMVSEPIHVKVIEVDRSRNRLILSERAAAKEARESQKERLLNELHEGEEHVGHVISLASFGAFVDLGGADGLVHLSEISWKRINHPSEVLKVGQKVRVRVLGVERERKRISLSMKALAQDPWAEVLGALHEGQLVTATVTKLAKFGAFARLEGHDEVEGLIHITELSEKRIEHPREVLQEGQTLTLRVVKLDPQARRIGLSLKRVQSADYSDMDWEAAMRDMSMSADEGEAPAPPEAPATEAPAAEAPPTEAPAAEAPPADAPPPDAPPGEA
jgi:small subunit ribosomal protein S1